MCNGIKMRQLFLKFCLSLIYGGLLTINLQFNQLADVFSIVITLLQYVLYIIVLSSNPGYLDLIKFKGYDKEKKSQMEIPSPQEDKQFSFDNPVTKVLQSSIVLYKKKGITSNIPDSDRNVIQEEIEIQLPQKRISHPVVYIEQPACSICNIDQLQRTKHCKSCRHCILTYDHHNILFGNKGNVLEKKINFIITLFQFLSQYIFSLQFQVAKLMKNNQQCLLASPYQHSQWLQLFFNYFQFSLIKHRVIQQNYESRILESIQIALYEIIRGHNYEALRQRNKEKYTNIFENKFQQSSICVGSSKNQQN
ncbi:hypothetical protein pb186bvf_014917 [Paramecium bursaria]